MLQALRFLAVTKRPSSNIDGSEYDLSFEVGATSGRGGEFSADRGVQVTAQVSGTLEAVWNIAPEKMGGIVAGIVLPMVIEAVREGRETELEVIRLNTYSMPHEPPGLWVGEGTVHIVAKVNLPNFAAPKFLESICRPLSFLSEDISEVRDQINALAKSLWRDRILRLSQERPLLDMYKSAKDQTEFRARIQSLGVISKDLNRDLLIKVSNVPSDSKLGDFVLLEIALGTLGSGKSIGAVTDNLKQINALRQGYPTHGDNADRFLQAHRHFRLPYPVTDFETAWESILAGYFSSMKALLDLLSEAWQAVDTRR